MDVSKASLNENAGREREAGDQTATSKVYRIIRDMATAAGMGKGPKKLGSGPGRRRGRGAPQIESDEEDAGDGELAMVEVRNRVFAKGFTETQLMDTILEVSDASSVLWLLRRHANKSAPALSTVRAPRRPRSRRQQHPSSLRRRRRRRVASAACSVPFHCPCLSPVLLSGLVHAFISLHLALALYICFSFFRAAEPHLISLREARANER